jgi:mono/diheme cytochrome c family protein
MRYLISIILIGAAFGAAIVGIAGFRGGLSRKPPIEIFPDMNRQLKLRPMEANAFFPNGVSSQLPPPGTIARSEPIQTIAGPVYSFEDSPLNTGCVTSTTSTTNFVETNPLPVNEALLQRGRERFDIYCAPCHGRLGDGNGITKKLGLMPAVANLHDQRIVVMTDGEIFNTIMHGKSTMAAYGPLMPAEDRWAVIAYLRALQLSWLGSTNDLPADQQAALTK